MRYSIVLLLAVIVTCVCNNKSNKVSLSKGRLITYTMPYPGFPGCSTHFTLDNGQEAIAFFNSQTYKRMDVFDLNTGKPIKTIPLKELLMLEPHIDDIAALNRDSFLALGQGHNNVYLFNSEGKVLRQAHISDIIPFAGHVNWHTELSSTLNDGFVQDDSTLLFSCSYYQRITDTTLQRETSTLQWYRTNRALPYFLSVRNIFAPHPRLLYALSDFYNHFLPDNGINAEEALYTVTPQNVLLYSNYSDSLYVLNKHNYEVEKAVKIRSAYTRANRKVETVDNLNQDSFNLRGSAAGMIREALYDKYRSLYYVAVRHGLPLNTPKAQMQHNRKWSLLVYNKKFDLLEEINMDPRYYPGEMLITREGIMLQLDDYEKPDVPAQFQLFHIHQK